MYVFHGSVATDLTAEGVVAIPHDSPVMGRVVDAKDAAHFKGNALLSIELTQVTRAARRSRWSPIATAKQARAWGKNTAEKAGGGALFGAIIGALAGGGKGAAIGTLAGGRGRHRRERGHARTAGEDSIGNADQFPIAVPYHPEGQDSAGRRATGSKQSAATPAPLKLFGTGIGHDGRLEGGPPRRASRQRGFCKEQNRKCRSRLLQQFSNWCRGSH